jgi:hypothetical protein
MAGICPNAANDRVISALAGATKRLQRVPIYSLASYSIIAESLNQPSIAKVSINLLHSFSNFACLHLFQNGI